MTTLSPALQQGLFDGRVTVYLFGRPEDWHISGEQKEVVHRRINIFCSTIGVTQLWAPKASTFNAQICSPDQLTEEIQLPGESKVSMFRGFLADGVSIPVGDAFWMSSADCITVVVIDPKDGTTYAAHGGRDCLIDRKRVNGGESREFESVVHAIAARFSNSAVKRLKVYMTCGIGPEHFDHVCDHPKYALANTKMCFDLQAKWGANGKVLHGDHTQGKICLSELIRSQFITLGVKPHNIGYDGVDTFEALARDGEYRWWSNRRGDGKKRNGVMVVRNW